MEALHSDIDQQAAGLSSYGQQYHQLGAGRFEGRFLTCHLDEEFSIYIEAVNCRLAQTLVVPDDKYAICVMMGVPTPTRINAAPLSQHQAIMLAPGAHATVATSEDMRICVLSAEKRLVEDNILFDPALIASAAPALEVSRGHTPSSVRLLESVRLAVSRLSAGQHRPTQSFSDYVHDSKVSLVTAALATLGDQGMIDTAGDRTVALRRAKIFAAVRDAIDAGLAETLSIAELCEELRVSRRTAEAAFQHFLGVSPYRYAKLLRLNQARRDLQSQALASVSIGDIAARWGIWHAARFATEYKSLFSELPSHTRAMATRALR